MNTRLLPKISDLFRFRSNAIWVGTLAACLALASSAWAAQPVRLSVAVPATTPADATLYIAGSLPAVGGWKADGLKLGRQSDGTYATTLQLDVGDSLEFKITRGSWETVEKNADGSERENRVAKIEAETKQIDVTVERWAAGDAKLEAKPASSVVGTLELHTVDSNELGKPRTIRVWLPAGYDAKAEQRYDVLYMHDGQNCFDRATSAFGNEWQIDETLTRLIAEQKVRPIIVVGIDNGGAERINELTFGPEREGRGGRGIFYTRFLYSEVMPFVEKHYRVATGPEHTFLGGSSLGGLASLEIVRRTPQTFGGAIAMSPSLWWNSESLTFSTELDAGGLKGTRIWLDMGTRESGDEAKSKPFVENARRMDAALTKHGVEHRLLLEADGAHNEQAWARRFPEAIQYLLRKR